MQRGARQWTADKRIEMDLTGPFTWLLASPSLAVMLEIAFRADRLSPEPLYRQLELYLRGLIEADRLPPGTKLPASRELAAALGLARVTVVTAYERLTRDGLLTSHVGQGSFGAGRIRLAGASARDRSAARQPRHRVRARGSRGGQRRAAGRRPGRAGARRSGRYGGHRAARLLRCRTGLPGGSGEPRRRRRRWR